MTQSTQKPDLLEVIRELQRVQRTMALTQPAPYSVRLDGSVYFPSGITIGGGQGLPQPVTSTPVPAPTNLVLSWGAIGSRVFIDASWTKSTDPGADQTVAYSVELAKETTGLVQTVQVVSTSVHFEPVEANTQYTVTVRPISAVGGIGSSLGPLFITTGRDTTVPVALTGFVANAGFYQVTLTWDESTDTDVQFGAGQYEAQRATDSDFTFNVVDAKTSATVFTFDNLTPKTQYWFRVRPIDSSGNVGPWSTPAPVTPGVPLLTDGTPPPFSPSPALTGGAGFIFASWTAVPNLDLVTYEVHCVLDPDPFDTLIFVPSAQTKVAEVAGTICFIRKDSNGIPLFTGNIYDVRIVAKDGDGAALPGAQVQGSPTPLASQDIGQGVITRPLIADAAIGSAQIETASIGSAQIGIGSIQEANIGVGQITKAVIAQETVDNSLIANATITGAKIANATITTAHINDLSADKITAGTLQVGQNITLGGMLRADRQLGAVHHYVTFDGDGIHFYRNAGQAFGAGGSPGQLAADFNCATNSITLDNGFITGGVIQGATFQTTPTANQRIVIKASDNGNEFVRFYPGTVGSDGKARDQNGPTFAFIGTRGDNTFRLEAAKRYTTAIADSHNPPGLMLYDTGAGSETAVYSAQLSASSRSGSSIALTAPADGSVRVTQGSFFLDPVGVSFTPSGADVKLKLQNVILKGTFNDVSGFDVVEVKDRGDTPTYGVVRAAAFSVASSEIYKINIREFEEEDALATVRTVPVRTWDDKATNIKRHGLVVEELPDFMQMTNTTYDVISVLGVLWRAVQQLAGA